LYMVSLLTEHSFWKWLDADGFWQTNLKGSKSMAEIARVYRQTVPAMRFIGKKYGDEDRVNGGFGAKWEECFESGLFARLEKLADGGIPGYDESGAYIGLMRWKQGEPFEYWIGMFAAANTSVPQGLDYLDFPESELGVCWVYGHEQNIYGLEEQCALKLIEEGYEIRTDAAGAYWFFERYVCPRFTIPDQDGKIILDLCHYI